jgi:hypothetical protein
MLSCIESHQNQNVLASSIPYDESFAPKAQEHTCDLAVLGLDKSMKKKPCTLTYLVPNAASKSCAKLSLEELMNLTKEARPESTVTQTKTRTVKHE